jgi:hypothetical protein
MRAKGQESDEKLFIFNVWMGDQLVSIYPYYLATEELAGLLERSGFTGFEARPAEVRKGEQFHELRPEVLLPRFVLLEINGLLGQSDFSDHANALVVSSEALETILSTKPRMLRHEPFAD